ncbi:MAG TPA: hypothetical protein VMF65_06105 [Acidimicrobiales bacterium]|nr:hypothetical protein [Acidimicrobiales bacterium]
MAKGARITKTFGLALVGAGLMGVALTGVVPLSGAAAASAVGTRPIMFPCTVPQGTGPTHAAVIGNAQNGTTICVAVGERLLVSLSAPAGTGTQWQQVTASPPGVLVRSPMPVTASEVVTSTTFLAMGQGRARLSSQRRACPATPAGSASCEALISWGATVEVRGPHRNLPVPRPLFSPLLPAAS